jgi:toxin ParE1/3/4
MARLVSTARFRFDTGEILEYLERAAGALTAENYSNRFRTAIERLVEFPETGAPRPALGLNARVIIVSTYILIYDYVPEDDEVVLVRMLHGRRNITRRLVRRR